MIHVVNLYYLEYLGKMYLYYLEYLDKMYLYLWYTQDLIKRKYLRGISTWKY